MRIGRIAATVLVASACQLPLLAKCPIPDNGTLVVRAPVGNLLVDTKGQGFVDVTVTNKDIQVHENCLADRVELTGTAARALNGSADWKITVPAGVQLDLLTDGGSIQVGDSDGNVTLRTTGGPVTAGNIRGRVAIVTQGGSIKAGNIGNNAEMRSLGGPIEAGNIAGDAELWTSSGSIDVGVVAGYVNAETGGGNITIRESRGAVKAETQAGNISVGLAGPTTVKTAGGNLIFRKILGFFKGATANGDIRLDSVSSWVEATTGSGNIVCRLEPDNLEGDRHVELTTGMGDITLSIPEKLSAQIRAVVEQTGLSSQRISQRIVSDFPAPSGSPVSTRNPGPTGTQNPQPTAGFFGRDPVASMRYEAVLNQGKNRIRLTSKQGTIEIRRR